MKSKAIYFSSIKLAKSSQNLIKTLLLMNSICLLFFSQILNYLLVFSLKVISDGLGMQQLKAGAQLPNQGLVTRPWLVCFGETHFNKEKENKEKK